MNEASLDQPLVTKRFPMTPESFRICRFAVSGLNELQKDKPWVSGVGFFGSRMLGLEKPQSDLDLYVFYDSQMYRESLGKPKKSVGQPGLIIDRGRLQFDRQVSTEEARHFVPLNTGEIHDYFRQLLQSHSVPVMQTKEGMKDSFTIDISRAATTEQLNWFSNDINDYISGRTSTKPPISAMGTKLIARFLLTVGDKVYQNRRFILDHFDQKSVKGSGQFTLFMEYLADFERTKRGRSLPALGYPKTIQEARAYFLTKPY